MARFHNPPVIGCGDCRTENEPHIAADPEPPANRLRLSKSGRVTQRIRRARKPGEPEPAECQRGQRRGASDSPEQKWKGNRA